MITRKIEDDIANQKLYYTFLCDFFSMKKAEFFGQNGECEPNNKILIEWVHV